MRVSDRLHEEHEQLLLHIDYIRDVADRIQESSLDELRRDAKIIHEFLTEHLVPHAMAEDSTLYAAVAAAAGSDTATATMTRDHSEVVRLTTELGDLRDALRGPIATPGKGKDLRRSLSRLLYGLYSIIRLHFAKEEEILLPLVDGLPEREGERVFEAMELAEREAKQRAAA